MGGMPDRFLLIAIVEDELLWIEGGDGVVGSELIDRDSSACGLSQGVFFVTVPYLGSHNSA